MSKLVLVLCSIVVAGAISGCAASPSPSDRKLAAFSEWQKDASAREAAGKLSRVDKLKEMYAQLAKEPVSVSDVAGMRWASSDITTLEAYQAGKIDRAEAESRLRQSETTWQSERAAQNAAARPANTRCITWQGFTQCATQ
ncbi:hypothetical protein [Achromobacter denitrificans]|uniref:hypothetical protein n=1 Tax=Achromobacter denitrificans TaxID=32002 RepID=UPI0012F796FC|nr:hypothetical protein [Achromobacter denitrificans]